MAKATIKPKAASKKAATKPLVSKKKTPVKKKEAASAPLDKVAHKAESVKKVSEKSTRPKEKAAAVPLEKPKPVQISPLEKKQLVEKEALEKVKLSQILISQPAPESGKSPYFEMAGRYKTRIHFRNFTTVEGLTPKEFRRQRITMNYFTAIIFTSRNAIDLFFKMCQEMRTVMSQETKYFCTSEAIALYLQKYIQYRKRKIFFGNGNPADLNEYFNRFKANDRFMYVCSEIRKDAITSYLAAHNFNFQEVVFYRTVPNNLKDMDPNQYDAILLFSPMAIQSLFHNFPRFKQGNVRIGVFGEATKREALKHKLRIDIEAPTIAAPSMANALKNYLTHSNK